MAEINTGSKEATPGFVFGQNMENRVIKPPAEVAGDKCSPGEGESNGGQASSAGQAPSLLRPSAFKPSGLIAPSRLGSNPFVSSSPTSNNTASHTEGQSVLSAGQLAANPFAARISMPHASVSSTNSDSEESNNPIASPRFTLKPSALDKQTAGLAKGNSVNAATPSYKSSFRLEPAKLHSPLCSERLPDAKEGDSAASGEPKSLSTPGAAAGSDNGPESASQPEGNAPAGEAEAAPDNKPKDESSSSEGQTDSESKAFVFGQNLHERVQGAVNSCAGNSGSGFVFGQNMTDRATPSKQGPNDTEEEKDKSPTVPECTSSPTQTLAESAAAHEAKKAKPELQEVEVVTGEENESNVFQLNAKLFQFDKDTQNWLERGRGLLRLNDMSTQDDDNFQSRLVMRTTGILRLVLNTKIWPGMMVDRANNRNIRISAVDSEDGTVKVFLIMANPKDADQIFSAIDWRVQQMKMRERKEETAASDSATDSANTASVSQPEKRSQEDTADEPAAPNKKARVERDTQREESNDSSTLDPETEASNESCASTIKSSSSE